MTASTTVGAVDAVISVDGYNYSDHGSGWSEAVKLAYAGEGVTVKLFADWTANSSTGFTTVDGVGVQDGARIGISASTSCDLVSGDDSKFKAEDYKYFFADKSTDRVRAVYDSGSENHMYKIYVNYEAHADARYPIIASVAVKDDELLKSATIDVANQVITLTSYKDKIEKFKNISLDSLITYTTDDTVIIPSKNFTSPVTLRIMSDNNTYALCTVNVVFVEKTSVEIDMGEKKAESNVRFVEINGIQTPVTENLDNIYDLVPNGNTIVEITEKASEDKYERKVYFKKCKSLTFSSPFLSY